MSFVFSWRPLCALPLKSSFIADIRIADHELSPWRLKMEDLRNNRLNQDIIHVSSGSLCPCKWEQIFRLIFQSCLNSVRIVSLLLALIMCVTHNNIKALTQLLINQEVHQSYIKCYIGLIMNCINKRLHLILNWSVGYFKQLCHSNNNKTMKLPNTDVMSSNHETEKIHKRENETVLHFNDDDADHDLIKSDIVLCCFITRLEMTKSIIIITNGKASTFSNVLFYIIEVVESGS